MFALEVKLAGKNPPVGGEKSAFGLTGNVQEKMSDAP